MLKLLRIKNMRQSPIHLGCQGRTPTIHSSYLIACLFQLAWDMKIKRSTCETIDSLFRSPTYLIVRPHLVQSIFHRNSIIPALIILHIPQFFRTFRFLNIDPTSRLSLMNIDLPLLLFRFVLSPFSLSLIEKSSEPRPSQFQTMFNFITLPQQVLSPLHVHQLRFYITALDLLPLSSSPP
jgi:hypothetical protein